MTKMSVSSSAIPNVFVYGTLLADEVLQVLLKRVPSSSPALLPNYHRYSIKGRVYPAIIPTGNKEVSGKVLFGITDHERGILDTFEDVEYERKIVEVSLLERSESLQAHAYVWVNKSDPDLYGDWDYKEWREKELNDYVNHVCEFIAGKENPESETIDL